MFNRDVYIGYIYRQGLSSTEIGRMFKISATTVLKIVRKQGVRVRTNSESKRKYELREHFFDKIDSENKAYFLGFLFADGCNNGKAVVLSLRVSDADTLEKLNKLIYPARPLIFITEKRNGKQYKKCSLQINSLHMLEKLLGYGLIRRKTSKLMFPTIPKQFEKAFIRGYFDGDGGVSVSKPKGRRHSHTFSLSIVSTKPFLSKVKEIIEHDVDIVFSFEGPYSKDGAVFKLKLSGTRQVQTFLKYLYADATIFMQRKRNMIERIDMELKAISARKCAVHGCKASVRSVNLCWKHLIAEKRKYNPNFFIKSQLDITKAVDMYKSGASQREIAKHFGVSPACICKHFKKLGLT